MADPRHAKLAKVLVQYSLNVQADEKVAIFADFATLPLVKEIFREVTQAQAFPVMRWSSRELNRIYYRHATEAMLKTVTPLQEFEADYFDAELHIMGENNTRTLGDVAPERLRMASVARQPIRQRQDQREVDGKFRWCLTQFPTDAYAQDAGLALEAYEDFVFGAGLLHLEDPVLGWKQQHDEQARIIDYLSTRDEIRIVTPQTNISYRVKGRVWENCDGRVNFPDGEVFTAPIEDSVNGTVHFTYPAIYVGIEVEGVRLTFQDGKVVDAHAEKGEAFLHKMLDSDEGARRLGEVAFGTNYSIQRFSKSILFDEKIGGTMHMALGQAYGASGGVNQSSIHWDMVADLHDARVYADGDLCYENGKFLI